MSETATTSNGAAQVDPLVQAAQQQQQARSAIEQLGAVVRGLDAIVRQEIRSALVEEFQALGDASHHAAQALDSVRRAASLRIALWAAGVVCACAAIPLTLAWSVLPSRVEITRMRAERDRLQESVALLEQRGGKADLRRCGPASRLCVRIDRTAPAYGAHGEYLVVKGY